MSRLKESNLIFKSFQDYFEVLRADTEALKEAVYRIRYEVYCKELAFENADEFPQGLEKDEFDDRADHCLLRHRETGRFAGCVRLIAKPSEASDDWLPFEKHCWQSLDSELMHELRASGVRYGEISRLAVPAEFRRRKGEMDSPIGENGVSSRQAGKRQSPHIALGLYLAATSIGLQAGLDGVFAMMEPRLARHLKRYGFIFRQAGEVMDYHGKRAPFYISKELLFDGLNPEIGELLFAIKSELSGIDHF